MQSITFESLPQAVSLILSEVAELKQLLIANQSSNKSDLPEWFDIAQLCNYLPDKPAKPTVYAWVHNRVIPCHKSGKKLRFLKSEIDLWLLDGKKKTVTEIDRECDHFLTTKDK